MSKNEYKYLLYLCSEGLNDLEAQTEAPTLYFSEYIAHSEKTMEDDKNMANQDDLC